MNNRIKQLRQSLNLSQEKFGENINLSKATISSLENATRSVTDRVMNDICTTYNVNPVWLHNGIGEIFLQTESSVIAELAKEFNATDLEVKLLKAYFAIDKDVRSIFMSRLIKNLNEEQNLEPKQEKDNDLWQAARSEMETVNPNLTKTDFDKLMKTDTVNNDNDI